MNRLLAINYIIIFLFLTLSCADNKQESAENDLKAIISRYENELVPLLKNYNLQSYLAATTGEFEAYEQAAQLRYKMGRFFTDKKEYAKLKKIIEKNSISDPFLNRQARLLYYEYLQYQIPEKKWRLLVNQEKELKKHFSQFRVSYKGKELNNAQIREMMKHSKSTEELETIWKASKYIGQIISDDLVQLVKMRNEAAQSLGFENYLKMRLFVSDLDEEQVDRIYDELDILTRGPFTQLKADIDNYLGDYYGIDQEKLRPWHYQDMFFQNPPEINHVNYDSLYAQQDIAALGSKFYKSLGFDVEYVVRNSDLYPKEKKSQLGVAKNIDYEGDVRISVNLKQDEYSMNQFFYELGFALYLKNISSELPFVLRKPAHFFTTDAVAILFSSLSTDPLWLNRIHNFTETQNEELRNAYIIQQRLRKFVFSRWAQVAYRFEKAMYENPDQNLNELWWQLVENYQLIKRPEGRSEPDWAVKEHFVALPCTYHNYMFGELFAAQLHHHIASSILSHNHSSDTLDLYGHEVIGDYLRKEVFAPGASYHWQELVKRVTGEELNPDYFYQQYIR